MRARERDDVCRGIDERTIERKTDTKTSVKMIDNIIKMWTKKKQQPEKNP